MFRRISIAAAVVCCTAIITFAHSVDSSFAVCTDAPTGMVSWWGGDNNALDITGKNHGA